MFISFISILAAMTSAPESKHADAFAGWDCHYVAISSRANYSAPHHDDSLESTETVRVCTPPRALVTRNGRTISVRKVHGS